jgi:hypothetical protein
MNGEKRYDYAMIEFVSDDGLKATCLSMILGFLGYNMSLGIPTLHFSDEEGQSLHTIQDNMALDKNLYVVVHTASDYVSIKQFQHEFVSSFTLGDISNCVYIIKVEAIYGPLFVFQNYGSVGYDKNQLFCALPKSKWGKYFDDRIQKSS